MAISSEVFHFDEFTLNVRERRLLNGTEAVRLSCWGSIFVAHRAGISSAATVFGKRSITAYTHWLMKSGYLKVPNEILDLILPSLNPSEAVIFLRLYRLSAGFQQNHCTVGMAALTRACNLSESSCRRALRRLMELGFIRQIEVVNTRQIKGTTYQINTGIKLTPVPVSDWCQAETSVRSEPKTDDDIVKNNHHQSRAALDEDSAHLREIKNAYLQLTGNSWLAMDTLAYRRNNIARIPADTAKEVMKAVKERCGTRINSFNYFVKEISGATDPRNRRQQRRALAKIIKRIRDLHVGAHDYAIADFVEDVKRACAREGVIFDNDLFNSFET